MSNAPSSGIPLQLPGKLGELFHVTELPTPSYQALWDSVYVGDGVKTSIFNAVAMQGVFRSARSCIGLRLDVILFFGLAGSGKTTLARGVSNCYAGLGQLRDGKSTILLEANASRWFGRFLGESAKIVDEAFQAVRLLLKRRRIAMLINEVESVATRRTALSAGDPTDVHRFVNSLLNALDDLDARAEFLMLATSNQPQLIDEAFLDRAPYRFHLGYCDSWAARAILHDTARAFRSTKLVIPDTMIDQIIEQMYGDPDESTRLSGRDLSDLFRLTAVRFSTLRPKPHHVIEIAKYMQRRNSNGSSC